MGRGAGLGSPPLPPGAQAGPGWGTGDGRGGHRSSAAAWPWLSRLAPGVHTWTPGPAQLQTKSRNGESETAIPFNVPTRARPVPWGPVRTPLPGSAQDHRGLSRGRRALGSVSRGDTAAAGGRAGCTGGPLPPPPPDHGPSRDVCPGRGGEVLGAARGLAFHCRGRSVSVPARVWGLRIYVLHR